MRLPRLTLSLRITVLFALGALLISAAVAFSASLVTTRLLVSEQQHNALHQTYLNAAIAKARLRSFHHDVPAIVDDLNTGTSSQEIIYTAGRWYSSSLLESRDALPAQIRSQTLAKQVVWEWTTVAGDPAIVVGIPFPALDSAYFQIFDESPMWRTANVLRTVLIIAAAATTVAGGALGWFAGRRLTAPLRSVTLAARRIAAGDLETRLPNERDHELAQLVSSFNAMVSALRERMQRDARFAADVSHELRSPLTTVTTALGVLQARRDELSERGQEALRLLGVELSRFARLVEDLLEISRADVQPELANPEPVRLGQLILSLLERPQYQQVQAQFDGDALDALVPGDKRRLEQVFRNVLDNATAYGSEPITIRARVDDSEIVTYVDDCGPGIPEEDRDRVFDRFARGRSGRRGSHSGTGLGLALVREHLRVHRGTVHIADAPCGGARIVITLPTEQT